MYRYTSNQTSSELIKGKRRTKTRRVNINGNSGYKLIIIRNKSGTKKSKKPLTKNEIKCIKKCKFVKGLFDDCEKCLY